MHESVSPQVFGVKVNVEVAKLLTWARQAANRQAC